MLLVAFDDVGILQAYFLAWCQTHELLVGFLHEVVALDPELTAEFHLVCAVGLVLGIVDGCQLFILVLRVVRQYDLHGI